MSTELNIFGQNYSSFYDCVYQNKDYSGECDMLEKLFKCHCSTKPKTIVDFGCGTGNHSICLAYRNYTVTGIDRSHSMLQIAQEKAQRKALSISFIQGDMCSVNLNREFDAGICMFAVLCYQHSNDALESALQTCSHHIRSGGIFIFDFWYGPAVLSIRPETRLKVFENNTNNSRLIRTVEPNLDTITHRCISDYRLLELEGAHLIKETHERHITRYFFPLEIEYFLIKAGFKLKHLGAFPECPANYSEQDPTPPSDSTWNAIAVAIKN